MRLSVVISGHMNGCPFHADKQIKDTLSGQNLMAQTRTMSSNFRFGGQQLDNGLVGSVSCLRDAAKIPNLPQGKYLLTIYHSKGMIYSNQSVAR